MSIRRPLLQAPTDLEVGAVGGLTIGAMMAIAAQALGMPQPLPQVSRRADIYILYTLYTSSAIAVWTRVYG